MSKLPDTQTALFARAALLETTGPSLPIAWPEPATDFVPPADGKYLDVQFIPNVLAWQGISSGRMDQGLLQVAVVWPKNLGLIAPAAVAQQVIDHFSGATLYAGAVKVTITAEPWLASVLPDGDRLRLPVLIPWQA